MITYGLDYSEGKDETVLSIGIDNKAYVFTGDEAEAIEAYKDNAVLEARLDELKTNLSSPSGMTIKYYQTRLKELS